MPRKAKPNKPTIRQLKQDIVGMQAFIRERLIPSLVAISQDLDSVKFILEKEFPKYFEKPKPSEEKSIVIPSNDATQTATDE